MFLSADLRLCFGIGKNLVFSLHGSYFIVFDLKKENSGTFGP